MRDPHSKFKTLLLVRETHNYKTGSTFWSETHVDKRDPHLKRKTLYLVWETHNYNKGLLFDERPAYKIQDPLIGKRDQQLKYRLQAPLFDQRSVLVRETHIWNSWPSHWEERPAIIIRDPLFDERGPHSELIIPSMAKKTHIYIKAPYFWWKSNVIILTVIPIFILMKAYTLR